jgi:antitoxin HicB
MSLAYPYTVEPQEGGGLFVQFVDLEEAFTEGATPEEAAFNAAEVLSGILSYRLEQGDTIPVPSSAPDLAHIAPSAEVQAAILLRQARGDRPLSDLARALETSWAAAQRLEDPRHWPTLKQLDRAARVLGKRLVLSLE